MSANEYHFVTRWRVEATAEEVFDVLEKPLDLVRWWDQARRGKAPKRRHVKIELLGDDDAVVMTWRFRNARPCSLAYSPLRASEGVVLMETIELAFDTVEVS